VSSGTLNLARRIAHVTVSVYFGRDLDLIQDARPAMESLDGDLCYPSASSSSVHFMFF